MEADWECLNVNADGPDLERFLARDLATLAKELPNDIRPATGVRGITGNCSSSALSSESSSKEKADTGGTAESERWRCADDLKVLL